MDIISTRMVRGSGKAIHMDIISTRTVRGSGKAIPMDIISTRTVRGSNRAARALPAPKTAVARAGVPVAPHTDARLLHQEHVHFKI